MKLYVFGLLFLSLTFTLLVYPAFSKPGLNPGEVFLLLNAPEINATHQKVNSEGTLPRNWRTTDDPFRMEFLGKSPPPSRVGLEKLHISGSSEFSKGQFKKIQEKLKNKKMIVIDLRQEPHGFVNNYAISWYGKDDTINSGKTLEEIESDEVNKLNSLTVKSTITLRRWIQVKKKTGKRVWKLAAIPQKVASTSTEKKFLNDLNIDSMRIPVPDHQRPIDSEVDRFVARFQKPENDLLLHFHCAAGEGRTTTFMAMYDMMRNCQQVSLDDIVRRQRALGGVDLFATTQEKSTEYKYKDTQRKSWSIERANFIKAFYGYCKAQSPGFAVSWSKWVQKPL